MVTGAGGFIGRFYTKNSAHIITPISLREITIEKISFRNIDAVVYLAGLAHQDNKTPEERYYEVNTYLTERFALESKKKGIKHFIFVSTVKIYGENNDHNSIWDEDTVPEPKDAYGKSKLMAEQKLSDLDDEGFHVTIIRIPLVIGPSVKGNLNKLFRLICSFVPVIPIGAKNNKRSIVSVHTITQFIDHIVANKFKGIFLLKDADYSSNQLINHIMTACNVYKKVIALPFFAQKILRVLLPGTYYKIFGSLVIDNNKTLKQTQFTNNTDMKTVFDCSFGEIPQE